MLASTAPGASAVDFDQDFFCVARDCLRPYREFAAANPAAARPIDEATLLDQIAATDAAALPGVLDLDTAALRAAIVDALNIGFLLADMTSRPVNVSVLEETTAPDGAVARTLALDDPFVGTFRVRELEPPGRHRLAAVIGLHGHLSSPAEFARAYLGEQLAADGTLVVMPEFRAMDCLPTTLGPESTIAWDFLRNGFTLIGLRVYEALLVERYLRTHPRIDVARIGLLSHSGGSSTASLVAHLSDTLAARVSDYAQDWRNRCGGFGLVHCETVPALFVLGPTIDDLGHQRIPRLVVPYEFATPESRAAIMQFFENALHALRCVRPADLAACASVTLPAPLTARIAGACRATRAAEGSRDGHTRRHLRSARHRWRQAARALRRNATDIDPGCVASLAPALSEAAAQRPPHAAPRAVADLP